MRLTKTALLIALAGLGTACGASRGPRQSTGFFDIEYRVGLGPAQVLLADLDCDGRQDVVTRCEGDSSVFVMRRLPIANIGSSGQDGVSLNIGSSGQDGVSVDLGGHRLDRVVFNIGSSGQDGVSIDLGSRGQSLPVPNIGSSGQDGVSVQFRVSDSTNDLCLVDLDSDGLLDLVAITGDPDFDLLVFQNDPTDPGTFLLMSEYLVPGNLSRVSKGDVNGDGLDDVVVLDESTGLATLLLNSKAAPGNLLAPGIPLPPFSGACSDLQVGDLDGDGMPDVMTLTDDGAFSFLRQSPKGTFTQKTWLPSNFRVRHSMAVGDMNRDGHLDVVLSGEVGAASEYEILLQDPSTSAGFRESPTLKSTGRTTAMQLVDLNRDGRLDLVAMEADATGATTPTLYPGNPSSPAGMSKGTVKFFNEAKGFGRALAIADADRNGFFDIWYGDDFDGVHALQRIRESPTRRTFARSLAIDAPPGQTWVDVAIGDVNGDGKADIVAGGSDGITVLFQDAAGGGTFSAKTFPVGLAVQDIALRDMDRDGKIDVAFTSPTGKMGVLWHNAIAPEGFDAPTAVGLGALCHGIAVGDVDGDGMPDLVTTCVIGGAGTVQVKRQQPGLVRTFDPVTLVFPAGPNPLSGLVLRDLDCDDRDDIACPSSSGDTLAILWHAPGFPPPGPGLFEAPQIVPFTGGVFVAAADVNGDGFVDVVTTDASGASLLRESPSRPSLGQIRLFSPGGGAAGLALADLDLDGDLDIVLEADTDGDGFTILENDSTASDGFRIPVKHPAVLEVPSLRVATGDLNGDGFPDIVTLAGPDAAGVTRIVNWTGIFDE